MPGRKTEAGWVPRLYRTALLGALLVGGLAGLQGCSLTPPARRPSLPLTRVYHVPPDQLREAVVRAVHGAGLGVVRPPPLPAPLTTGEDGYPGQAHCWLLGCTEWQERSRYTIGIAPWERPQGVISILSLQAETEERRGPGDAWQAVREAPLAHHRMHALLHALDVEVRTGTGGSSDQ
jgi:hypothetical protein